MCSMTIISVLVNVPKVRDSLSSFLPTLPGIIDTPAHLTNSSLRSLIEKPPVFKEFTLLNHHQVGLDLTIYLRHLYSTTISDVLFPVSLCHLHQIIKHNLSLHINSQTYFQTLYGILQSLLGSFPLSYSVKLLYTNLRLLRCSPYILIPMLFHYDLNTSSR